MTELKQEVCSFCNSPKSDTNQMIGGGEDGTRICESCIKKAHSIVCSPAENVADSRRVSVCDALEVNVRFCRWRAVYEVTKPLFLCPHSSWIQMVWVANDDIVAFSARTVH